MYTSANRELYQPTLVFVNFIFCNHTATTEIYTLSLHDALPIWSGATARCRSSFGRLGTSPMNRIAAPTSSRSEEHTSELQSRFDLVCRLLLEKKKRK